MAMSEIVMVASIVSAVCAMVRTSLVLWKTGFRLRRPSIWTRRGRLLLNAEACLRHPFSREKRAELEFSQGWNDPELDAT